MWKGQGRGSRSQVLSPWMKGHHGDLGAAVISNSLGLHKAAGSMVRVSLGRWAGGGEGGCILNPWMRPNAPKGPGAGLGGTVRTLHHCCPHRVLVTLRREEEEEINKWK